VQQASDRETRDELGQFIDERLVDGDAERLLRKQLVREEDEFKAGHIPGTVNIPRGVLEFRIYKQLGYPKTVDLNKKISMCSARPAAAPRWRPRT